MTQSTSKAFQTNNTSSAEQFVDADESDFETPSHPSADEGDSDDPIGVGKRDRVFKAKDLAAIGSMEEMAPITLQKDPKEVREANERRKERSELRIKGEGSFLHFSLSFSLSMITNVPNDNDS